MRLLIVVPALVLAGLLAGMPAAHADADTPLVADLTSLDFGNVPVGESRTRTVTLTNAGPTTFTWGFIFYLPDSTFLDGPYAMTPRDGEDKCGGSDSTMAAGETCLFDVTFRPEAAGTFTQSPGRCDQPGAVIYVVPANTQVNCSSGENFGLALSGVGVVPQSRETSSSPSQSCAGLPATIVGTDGADRIAGTPGDDVIAALGGNDTVVGLGGNDVVCAGVGDDKVKGGAGTDRLFGDDGRDRLVGGPGRPDLCDGGTGKDRARGCEIKAAMR